MSCCLFSSLLTNADLGHDLGIKLLVEIFIVPSKDINGVEL